MPLLSEEDRELVTEMRRNVRAEVNSTVEPLRRQLGELMWRSSRGRG